MIVEKIAEKRFNYYFFLLENFQNTILIDDSETSLSIYNSDLQLLKKISSIPEFGIHYIYKNCIGNTLLFSSGDDPCLLWVNLDTKQHKLIDVSYIQGNFLELYSWQEERLILITENNEFYYYDIRLNNFIKLQYSFVKESMPVFFNFFQYYSQFSFRFDTNSCYQTFIQFDFMEKKAIYHNFKCNFTISVMHSYENDHFMNIRYYNKIFAFLYENIIFLYYNDIVYKFLPESPSDLFQNVSFLENNDGLFLFVHVVDNCDFYKGKVQKYQIIL